MNRQNSTYLIVCLTLLTISLLKLAQPIHAQTAPTATLIPPPSLTPTPTVSPTTTPLPSATPAVLPIKAEILAGALNLRTGPGLNYPHLDTLLRGQQLSVQGRDQAGNWLQVSTDTAQQGWISAQPRYTRLRHGSLADLSIVTPTLVIPPALAETTSVSNTLPMSISSSGTLIFATSSGGELYRINTDGSNLQRLAQGIIDPVISPDGQQIAFTRWDGAEFGALFVINVDGTGERAVVGDIRQPKSPTWSPDGQKIILSFQHGGLRDPGEECRSFDFDDGISIPDNAKITKFHVGENIDVCFIRNENLEWALRVVDVHTGQFEDLPSDEYAYTPTWDPKQPWRVIYDGDKGLMQLDINHQLSHVVTSDQRDTGPIFSPDGTQLALTYKQHGHWEIYTLDLLTGERRRLTKPPILADPQYNSSAPTWSPDGQQIAFLTDRTGLWEIWLMNVDGSNPHPMFETELPALRYDGVHERLLNWV
ncbi:SH3 domain-containing protein [Anaerolineales bacterium HSG25]|nr:SH3 domain-containing protein [Anaerolineales bacterium HSG25]